MLFLVIIFLKMPLQIQIAFIKPLKKLMYKSLNRFRVDIERYKNCRHIRSRLPDSTRLIENLQKISYNIMCNALTLENYI